MGASYAAPSPSRHPKMLPTTSAWMTFSQGIMVNIFPAEVPTDVVTLTSPDSGRASSGTLTLMLVSDQEIQVTGAPSKDRVEEPWVAPK